MRLRRVLARKDEGSIAIMAAVITPVVLLVIALALATLVWASSETETQRASDQAAVQAAASALLVDYPYSSIAPTTAALPSLTGVGATGTLPTLTPCETVGDPVNAVLGLTRATTTTVLGVTTTVLTPISPSGMTATQQAVQNTLPTSCSGLTTMPAIPAPPVASLSEACSTAEASMRGATYALRFYADDPSSPIDTAEPTCVNGRVRTGFSTQTPLIGFGNTAVGAGGGLSLTVPPQLTAGQAALAPLGVRLNTALPNAICPQVNVEVDQPVREPVFDRSSVPNGRSTARRVVKNAVVVPVFNGMAIASATTAVSASVNGLATVMGSGAAAVTLPAQNLNSTLLAQQQRLLTLLDEMDAAINARLAAANAQVTTLNGTATAVAATAGGQLGVPVPGVTTNLGNLNLMKCLRDTVSQVYDPPSGDAPTVQEVLAAAAANGEVVQAIQVGARSCTGDADPVLALSCVQAATGTVAGSASGLYDVPFLDVTPVLVKDIGNGNYQAMPVHATQASGAFRASLVRATGNSRYRP